jgi:hypothetical protein
MSNPISRFFNDQPRLYSKQTTALLTDLSGLAVVLFLACYFTVVGGMIVYDLVPAYNQIQ